jgi:hypothetical protein
MDNLLSNENVRHFLRLAEKVRDEGDDALTPEELEWAQAYVSAVIEQIVVPLVKVLKDAAQEIAVALTKALDALSDAAWTTAQLKTPISRQINIGPVKMADIGVQELNPSSMAIGNMEEGLARQVQREAGLIRQARLNDISGRHRYNR